LTGNDRITGSNVTGFTGNDLVGKTTGNEFLGNNTSNGFFGNNTGNEFFGNELFGNSTSNNHQNLMVIDQSHMSQLVSQGYTSSQPVNGPNDGPPLYQVPADALDVLHAPKPVGNLAIDPTLLATSNQTQGQ
jgi:hypothetical protein